MSLRRWVGVLVVALAIVMGGAWLAIKTTTDHLLYENATNTARNWAHYLATNVTDLEQIGSGEPPSAASMIFFEAGRKGGEVFRYTIFNRDGYSQLVSDRTRIASVDLSYYNPDAGRSIAMRRPVVDVKRGSTPDLPSYYAEAYVPILVEDRVVAVVAAHVDQTLERRTFYNASLLGAAWLCSLAGLSFSVPAIAFYLRTKQKQQADRRIRFLAHHDALTGLTNRPRLVDKLKNALNALATDGRHLAVHFLDVDHFKDVNDSLGHDGGDFLLKAIAERLRAATRRDDVAARLGGDEFVVVQVDVKDKEAAEEFAQRLVSSLGAPLHFAETTILPTFSVGVALAPADGSNPERLLKSADLALYKAKSDGRDRIRFFLPEMDAELQARIELERAVRNAVRDDRLELHYQPVFEMNGHRLIGFEALVRLLAADGTLIPPLVFVPVAEEMHLIDKIGAWALHKACQTAVAWPKELTVAVNLSPMQFETGSFSETVSAALAETGLEPHRLEVEISETLLLGNSEPIMAELRNIKALGVAVVMDDFGTGHSSLGYLWRFPFDKIKIYQSFMQAFEGTGRDGETVIRTIVGLGRELNMRIAVEGVETAKQVAFLDQADADQVQGFFFGQPIPAAEIAAGILTNFQKQIGHPPLLVTEPPILGRSTG